MTPEENALELMMDAVGACSLARITEPVFEVGGRYRRNIVSRGACGPAPDARADGSARRAPAG